MGFLSGIGGMLGKITDPGDFLGAQAGKAAGELSRDLGYETLGMQKDWMDYIKGQYEPYSEAGQRALGLQEGMLGDISALRGGPDYAAAAQSPLYQQMMKQGAEGITSQAAATGGLRGGNIQSALAENAQEALLTSAQQDYANQMQGQMNYFNTLGALSGKGLQGSQGLGQFGGSTLGGMSSTLSGIGTGALNQAAMQQQQGTGLLSAGAGLLAAFSDIRLKDNIKFTGEYSPKGHEIYTWEWNELAKDLNLSGKGKGVIADKVETVDPDAITIDDSGYKKVNYERV